MASREAEIKLRLDIPFPIEMLADQLVYYLHVNYASMYNALQKIEKADRLLLINRAVGQIAEAFVDQIRNGITRRRIEIDDEAIDAVA